MKDLRTFLDEVRTRRPKEIVDVERRVDPRHETTAILTKFEQRYRSPVLFFHDVAGCEMPVVTNVCGSLPRLALALGTSLGELSERYANGCANQFAPRVVTDAVVQSQIRRGEDVDLGTLPGLIYHENDSDRPYITAAIVAARDLESGKTNLSYHRLMIQGRNRTGIYMSSGKHLDAIYRRHQKAGQALPIAVILGAHPTWSIGALYSGKEAGEEYDVIGGLLGEPLDVVRCVSNDLLVPAAAEIVLEGEISATEMVDEGPFGEFTGYSTGVAPTPVFRVEAMTSRPDPIFQDIVSGGIEHATLPALGMEHHLLTAARAAAPGVRRVKLAVPLTVFVALEKQNDEEPRRLIEALLQGDVYTKNVIVVDAEVNVGDVAQVMTAVALNTQANRDLVVLDDVQGTALDPSVESEDGRTAKMGIDATTPLSPSRSVTRNSVAQELLDSIDLSEFLGS
jgi:2,5-furandicarboxylate decarboxylase 1